MCDRVREERKKGGEARGRARRETGDSPRMEREKCMSVTEDAAQQTMIDRSLTAEEFHQSSDESGREKDQSLTAAGQTLSVMSLWPNAGSKNPHA